VLGHGFGGVVEEWNVLHETKLVSGQEDNVVVRAELVEAIKNDVALTFLAVHGVDALR
jgi:hypothetical protein